MVFQTEGRSALYPSLIPVLGAVQSVVSAERSRRQDASQLIDTPLILRIKRLNGSHSK